MDDPLADIAIEIQTEPSSLPAKPQISPDIYETFPQTDFEDTHKGECKQPDSLDSGLNPNEPLTSIDQPSNNAISVVPASVPSTKSTTWHFFCSLPRPICFRIWYHCLPTKGSIVRIGHRNYLPTPLLQVSRESRVWASQYYQLIFAEELYHKRYPMTYINPHADTLVIDTRYNLGLCLKKMTSDVKETLGRLGLLKFEEMFANEKSSPWEQLQGLVTLPSLNKLSLVIPDSSSSGTQFELIKPFCLRVKDWPDELEEEDVEQLVVEELHGCEDLSFEKMKLMKQRTIKIREVLDSFAWFGNDWITPLLQVKVMRASYEDTSSHNADSIHTW